MVVIIHKISNNAILLNKIYLSGLNALPSKAFKRKARRSLLDRLP